MPKTDYKGVAIKVMPELANNSDAEATDQAILTYHTSYDLAEKISLDLGVDLGIQRFRESGDIERELATILGLSLSF